MGLKAWLRRISYTVIGLCVTVFCLLFTLPGHKLLVWVANHSVTGLKVSSPQVRLLSNAVLDVQFQNEQATFHASQFSLSLDWFSCATWCLSGSADKVTLHLAKPADESGVTGESEQATEAAPLSLPFSVAIKQFRLGAAELKVAGHKVNLSKLAVTARADEQGFQVKKFALSRAQIWQTDAPAPAAPFDIPTAIPALSFPAIQLPMAVSVEQFTVAELSYRPYEGELQALKQLRLSAGAEQSELSIHHLSLSYQTHQLALAAQADLSRWAVSGGIDYEHSDYQGTLAFTGDLNQLDLSATLSGNAQGKIALSVSPAVPNWPFSLTVNTEQLALGSDNTLQKLSLDVQGTAVDYLVNAHASVQLSEQLDLADPELDMQLAASGGLTALTLQKAELTLGEAHTQLSAQVSWQDGLRSQIEGELHALPLGAWLKLDETQLSGAYQLDFSRHGQQWRAQVNELALSGQLAALPLQLVARGKVNSDLHGEIQAARLSYGDSQIILSGTANEQLDVHGELSLAHQKNAVLPVDVQLSGQFTATGPVNAPNLTLRSQLDKLVYQDTSAIGGKLALSLDIAKDWLTDLNVSLSAVTTGDLPATALNVAGQGDQNHHQLTIQVENSRSSGDLTFSGQYAKQAWVGQLDAGMLRLDNSELVLMSPAELTVKADQIIVARQCWTLSPGQLCLAAEHGSRGQASIELQQLDLTHFNPLLSNLAELKGIFSGNAKAKWSQGQLEVLDGQLAMADAQVTIFGATPEQLDDSEEGTAPTLPLEIDRFSLALNSDAREAKANWQLALRKLGHFNGELLMPLQAEPQSVRGFVNIAGIELGKFRPLLRRLLWPDLELAGVIAGQVNIDGALTLPQLSGQLSAQDIQLKASELPLAISDLDLDVQLNGQQAQLVGLLNTAPRGQVALSGEVDWHNALRAKLNLSGEQLTLTPQPGVTLNVTPDLSLRYNGEYAEVTGVLTVPYGRVEIEELPQGVVAVSDDQVIVDKASPTRSAQMMDYRLDLDVRLLDDVRIKALGLDAYLTGELSLEKQLASALLASGEINLREGQYKAFGQDLNIETGQLGFNGPLDKPYINVRAIRNPETTANGVVAGVEVKGSIRSPELVIYSQPAMDQAQALAYLLNGQPLGDGQSNNNTMLAQFLLSQSIDRSKGYFAKAGETIGIQDVNLSAKGSGDDTQVEVSGYLTPSVQVSYRVGVFASLSEVAVRYRIFSKFYIEATSGLYKSIDLLYKFDWDE
ncbi:MULTISPECIES: translocation/assembly module TamB domain-containing protein [unclassified Pseudoalteromonas]|uniref:translocation/assembly module TamB domain-containing protein n=1 Tax=unclassified Pseudoalteromonas TaxID=194690 RepID=UPI002096D501|nr:translocation/assembly module TamB domain-containing protein [Pseudoalteromonas sp. XMcav2-N]MCO7189668.1 translocation/assembly module TamB domain-containing protein [Pseudoalteromonas sp. XMcav2-N]